MSIARTIQSLLMLAAAGICFTLACMATSKPEAFVQFGCAVACIGCAAFYRHLAITQGRN